MFLAELVHRNQQMVCDHISQIETLDFLAEVQQFELLHRAAS
jgi:hypothetical protein